MNPRAQQLKTQIEHASVLTPAERAEWLSLLDFMNDKQLMELEAILDSKVGASTATPTAVSSVVTESMVSPPRQPQPAPMAQSTPFFRPPASARPRVTPGIIKPPTAPAATAPVSAKLSVSDMPARPISDGKAFDAPVEQKPDVQAPRPIPSAHVEVPREKSIPKTVFIPESVWLSVAGLNDRPPLSAIKRLEDVGRLSVSDLRALGPERLVSKLQEFARAEGYFSVSFQLEQSPLFREYVIVGKLLLDSPDAWGEIVAQDPRAQALLSREEFEQVVDVIRQIQVN